MNSDTKTKSTNAKYVVMDEHTLGYLIDETPNVMGVLAGSVKRRGHNPMNGPATIVHGNTRLRPANEIDFEFFRVALPSDFNADDAAGDCQIEAAPKELAGWVKALVKVTSELVQAVEYTPLGVRGIKAVQAAKKALGNIPGSGC
ncbi:MULTISPECIES: hypothetical protein [Pandoraea]|uniref:Uncharacterized protein n=2 Tax=Pandoraea TaxID=93217 RepID=A0A5E4XHT6_9BURK|nr:MULTISPECIES: hypothetical protein [Pandoraea]VVE17895.1 hypothetical protein PCE31107_02992 [Pandoraea cepalis]VVE35718.1 hypothetical protein PTE31013_03913 [Pandoraea terrigena]